MSKDLATGAVITCLAVAVCSLVPMAGVIGSTFIPVPLIYFRAKLGGAAATVIAPAALACALLLRGPVEALFFGELLLIGVVMGELMGRQRSLEKTVAYVCAAVILAGAGGLLAAGLWTGQGLLETVSEGIRQHLELSLLLYQQMGLSQEQLDFLENSLDVIQRVLVGVMPAVVIGSTLMVTWVCLLTSRILFQRQGLPFPDYGALNRWKAPEPMVWAVIAAGVLLMVPSTGAKLLGLNGLIVFMVIYFFQGLAIVAYLFQKKQIPRFARVVLYGLIAIQQVATLAVIGVGFFDTWFNFRKLEKPLASG
jgi:uncharacterized protein YybS (DUF2232 family)